MSITDPDGNITYVNDMFCNVSKFERTELMGKTHSIVNSGYHPKSHFVEMWSTITKGKVWSGEVRNRAKDGTIWWANATIVPFLDEQGKPYQYVAIRSDITRQKEIEQKLRESKEIIRLSEQRFRSLVQHAHDMISILDEKGRVRYVSPSVKKFGYSVEELLNKQVVQFIHPDDLPNFRRTFSKVLNSSEEPIQFEMRIMDKARNWRDCEVVFTNLLKEPAVNGVAVNLEDITVSKQAIQKIHHMAYFDYLTKLPNKKLFESYLKDEFEKTRKDNGSFSLIYLDMDGFKYVNDSLGSKIGDTLLQEIAQRLKRCIGEKGILSRIEGDEFAAVFPQLLNGQLSSVAKDILQMFEEPFHVNEYELYITTSIGGSVYPFSGDNLQSLIANAHSALYEAKEKGKNRFQISSPNTNIGTYKRFTLKNDIRKALQNDEFYVVYQPRVDTRTNLIIGAEALIRWHHPKWGNVSPQEFISIAEEAGLIGQIGEKVLYTAVRQNKCWRQMGLPPIVISVNFSVLQFLETDMLKLIHQTLEFINLAPKWLEIEITETALMKDEKTVLAKIDQLKNMGINIAIDDFGTGYSSLSYLKKLKASTLKIDKSFIKNIPSEVDNTEIVSSVIHLAQKLKIRTVAEGVETLEQLNFLKKINCDEIQGYLYSRPLEPKDFERLLKQAVCKPKCDNEEQVEEIPHENRRRYFRIYLLYPLEGSMSISEFGGKKVSLGFTKILIRDIGPGGLQIETDIKLPVRSDILLKFTTKLFGMYVELYGYVVWNKELAEDFQAYGINFIINEKSRSALITILNQLQVKLRHKSVLPDCSFVTQDRQQFFNHHEKTK